MRREKMLKTAGDKKGLSLFEVALSAGIMALALSGVLAAYAQSVALNKYSRSLTSAASHAQHVLEDIRNTPYSTAISQIDANHWNLTGTQIYAKGLTALTNESITTQRTGSGPATITVTVTWDETQNRSRSLVFTTILGGT